MTAQPAPPTGYVTLADAADMLGVKPWDVVRLIADDRLAAVQLVDIESIRRHQEHQ